MEIYFGEIELARSRLARDRVLADLLTLARDSEELLKATAQDASDRTQDIRTRLNETLQRAKATCAQLQQQAVAGTWEAAQKARALVHKHPYESVGVAFGLGLLLSACLARRKPAGQP